MSTERATRERPVVRLSDIRWSVLRRCGHVENVGAVDPERGIDERVAVTLDCLKMLDRRAGEIEAGPAPAALRDVLVRGRMVIR